MKIIKGALRYPLPPHYSILEVRVERPSMVPYRLVVVPVANITLAQKENPQPGKPAYCAVIDGFLALDKGADFAGKIVVRYVPPVEEV